MKLAAPTPSARLDLKLAAQWSLRRADGESLEDDPAFRAWLCAHPDNPEVLQALDSTLGDIDRFSGTPEMVELRRSALAAAGRSHALRRVRARIASRPGIAAGVAFICFVLGAAFAYRHVDAHTFKTAVGERRIVALADGSTLSLDAATKVSVDYSTERRRLRLRQGRAKFDVSRDPLRPFSVEAGEKVVVATGTSFSVELVENQVRVVLYEGHVEVLPVASTGDGSRAKLEETRLQPGHELVASPTDTAAASQTAAIDTARSLAWESGDLAFADDSLALAVERVNRYSDKPLTLGDSAAGAVRISGIFHAGDTQSFVEGVTALFPVRAEQSVAGTTLVFDARKKH